MNMTCWFRKSLLSAAAAAALSAQSTPPNSYLVHNLVSDQAGVADHQDPKLVNPWGNSSSGTSPFWVGNNGSGTSTLYDGTGAATAIVVSIPQAGGSGNTGPVAGVMFNSASSNTSAFLVVAGKPAQFMFCSEDGVISGWNSTVDAANAKILFDNSKAGARYKGCALGGNTAAPLIFAANFANGTVDVYDAGMNLNPGNYAHAFANASVPAGFAPFNVAIFNGSVYVTYAKQDSQKKDDVAGAGNGFVAIFNQAGNLMGNLVLQGPLNSPWGMAMAPASFGAFGGSFLVGNFGDGKINAFDPTTGKQLGTLNDLKGNPISISGLWSINFGPARNADPGTLYFTSGPGGGTHGLFGSIQAIPFFTTSGITNAGSGLAGPVAPNTWMTLRGAGLSALTASSTTLSTSLGGAGVTINNEAAPMNFVSAQQINFLVPADIVPGTAQLQATNNAQTSAAVPVTVNFIAPAFFTIGSVGSTTYAAATHVNGSLIGPTSLKGTAAAPNETIVLYGTGFGQTSPVAPVGPVTAPLSLPVNPTIVIDGFAAQVTFAGLVSQGLYQFNVVVPLGVARGQDVLVVGLLGNAETQANAFIPISAQ
jgi:uncharacterized protein (TIGR03118 family)